MAFKLVRTQTFKKRVTANLPTNKAEVVTPVSFVAEFTKIGQDEFDGILAQLKDGDLSNADVVERYLVGAEDVQDEDGNPVDFSTAKGAILGDIAVNSATALAFVQGLTGAKTKNSKA